MKNRHQLTELVGSMGLVHLVDPDLALYFVDYVDKHVGVHGISEMVERYRKV